MIAKEYDDISSDGDVVDFDIASVGSQGIEVMSPDYDGAPPDAPASFDVLWD